MPIVITYFYYLLLRLLLRLFTFLHSAPLLYPLIAPSHSLMPPFYSPLIHSLRLTPTPSHSLTSQLTIPLPYNRFKANLKPYSSVNSPARQPSPPIRPQPTLTHLPRPPARPAT